MDTVEVEGEIFQLDLFNLIFYMIFQELTLLTGYLWPQIYHNHCIYTCGKQVMSSMFVMCLDS